MKICLASRLMIATILALALHVLPVAAQQSPSAAASGCGCGDAASAVAQSDDIDRAYIGRLR